jgi:hypothetical protein
LPAKFGTRRLTLSGAGSKVSADAGLQFLGRAGCVHRLQVGSTPSSRACDKTSRQRLYFNAGGLRYGACALYQAPGQSVPNSGPQLLSPVQTVPAAMSLRLCSKRTNNPRNVPVQSSRESGSLSRSRAEFGTRLNPNWNPRDHGYLTVYAAGLARHRLGPATDVLVAGRSGKRELCGGEIVPGPRCRQLRGPERLSYGAPCNELN